MEQVKKINLNETFALIKKLNSSQTGTIKSSVPTLDGLVIEFKKNGRAFDFSTGPINSVGEPANYQYCYYGLSKPFQITWNNKDYKVEQAGKGNIHMGKGFITSGELWDLDGITQQGSGYFRAVLPIVQPMKPPVHYMLGRPFSVAKSIRGAGLINLIINREEFLFYDYREDKQHYIVFESTSEESLSTFQLYLDVVLCTYGLISGAYIQDEILILQSKNNEFSSIEGFSFRRLKDSIDSPVEMISPRDFKDVTSAPNTTYFPVAIFEKLVQNNLDDKRLLRATRLIVESRGAPPAIQAATQCVALETVKGIIAEEKADVLRPIVDESIANDLKAKFKNILHTFPEGAFKGKERILRKIDDLNKLGNTESFALAFEIMGLPLSKQDKQYIANRNKFLHGNIPIEESEDPHFFNLHKISLHIQLLTCCLILKLAGYSGPVKNFWKEWEIKRGDSRDIAGLFRII